MIRLRRMIVIILMVLPMLANPVCASEDLSAGLTGDPRREGAEVKVLRHGNLIMHEYGGGSLWIILPFKGQSLFLKSDGLVFQFSREGKILAKGSWDKTSGEVKGLNVAPSNILSEVKDAVRSAGDHVDVKNSYPDALSDSSKGGIEWVQ